MLNQSNQSNQSVQTNKLKKERFNRHIIDSFYHIPKGDLDSYYLELIHLMDKIFINNKIPIDQIKILDGNIMISNGFICCFKYKINDDIFIIRGKLNIDDLNNIYKLN